jgi:hypothetical protein
MLINLTNHPSARWSEKQKAAADEFGEIVDVPFPQVEASADEQIVNSLGKEYLEKIKKISGETENIIEEQISKISENQKNQEINLIDI